MKRILFFDIDATLTKTIYDKKYDPLIVALSEIYDRPIIENAPRSGETAQSIVANILKANNISITDRVSMYPMSCKNGAHSYVAP